MTQKKLVSLIGALVLIIGAVALVTGCPQANNNKDNTTTTQTRAVYVGTSEDHGETYTHTITFNTDGTWTYHTLGEGVDVVAMQGTYTGDASKDGTITMTLKKQINSEGTALVDYTGADATKSITISGGKFSIGETQFTHK